MRSTLLKPLLIAAAAAVLTAGCRSEPLDDIDEDEATIAGAAAGAAVGHAVGDSTLATILGAVAGGILGREIIENRDAELALANNQPASLRTESGQIVHVEPVDSFERDGQPCREFRIHAEDGGTPREERAVACQTGPDTWRLAEAE
jgi:hypothetical protein